MKIIPESDNLLVQIKELLKDLRIEDKQSEGMKQSTSRNKTTTIPKGRILLINDKPEYGKRLIKWCTGKDYVITIARDVKEARMLTDLPPAFSPLVKLVFCSL